MHTCAAARVEATKALLAAAEEAPPAVLQPLPAGEEDALAVLDFLSPPPALRVAARLSFAAQLALLPRPLTEADAAALAEAGAARTHPVDWAAHHRAHSRPYSPGPNNGAGFATSPAAAAAAFAAAAGAAALTGGATEPGDVSLLGAFEAPSAADFGPRTVDGFATPADGVYHPPGHPATLRLGWACALGRPRGCDPFAPFPRQRQSMLEFYTPRLAPEHAAMQ